MYVSTPHRVAIPLRDSYSAAFFLDPNPDGRAEALPSCLKCGVAPKPGQNLYSCNQTDFLGLNKISGISPLTSAKIPVINPAFPADFYRTLYNVVRWTASTKDHIPAYLEPFLSTTGFLCKSALAHKDVIHYGFLNTSTCGSTS